MANLKTFERPAVTARQFTFAEPEVTDPAMASLKIEHGRLLRMMSDVFSGLDVDLACCSETEASRRRTSPSPDRNHNCSASPCFTCQEHGHMAWGCSKPTTATKWATSHWTARSLADKGPSLPVGMVVHLANPPRTSRQQTPPGPGFRLTRGRNRFPRPGKAAKEGEGGGRGTTEWWTEDVVATLQGEPQGGAEIPPISPMATEDNRPAVRLLNLTQGKSITVDAHIRSSSVITTVAKVSLVST